VAGHGTGEAPSGVGVACWEIWRESLARAEESGDRGERRRLGSGVVAWRRRRGIARWLSVCTMLGNGTGRRPTWKRAGRRFVAAEVKQMLNATSIMLNSISCLMLCM
jgi:hypothetical protein